MRGVIGGERNEAEVEKEGFWQIIVFEGENQDGFGEDKNFEWVPNNILKISKSLGVSFEGLHDNK